ncbi:MAG: hypothetical protein M3478_08910 [Planctomycetota bacterium]|nr:hypothetical protein [Planctomycetota bacterium]
MTTVEHSSSSAPHWETIARDVTCPLCAYNLRGLREPRCPECGYAFAWPDLLDPARRPHPYLFEHHPERNVRSFLRTYFAGLLPRRFFRTLRPIHAIHPRRLVAYWMITPSLLVLPFLAYLAVVYAQTVRETLENHAYTRTYFLQEPDDPIVKEIVAAHGSVDAFLDTLSSPYAPTHVLTRAANAAHFDEQSVRVMALVVLWPWLTLVTLMIFRASMRRAKVKRGHVVRCTLYACDWTLWLGTVAVMFITTPFAERWLPIFYPPAAVPILAAALFATYTSYRLGSAYDLYMNFDRPYATVMAAQAIVFLFIATVAEMSVEG